MSIRSGHTSGNVQTRTGHLKPSERVIEYLLAEFDRPDRHSGSRLPTVRQLATQLNVSVPTVHGVIRRLAKEGRVRTKHGSGTFLVAGNRDVLRHLAFTVSLPVAGSSLDNPWHHEIYAGMLKASLRSPTPISFLPGCKDSMLDADMHRSLIEQRGRADGLILFPFNRDLSLFEEVRGNYEHDGRPVVTMHPAADSTTVNFVSPDYHEACFRAGRSWTRTGRRHVVFLMVQSFEASTSARLRWSGLVNGLGLALGDNMTCRALPGASKQLDVEESAYAGLREALQQGLRMDAVFAASDFSALGAVRALREEGLRVPDDVSVVGSSGLDLSATSCPNLTRTRFPLAEVGEKLVEMLCRRVERRTSGDNDVGGIYLRGTFIGGATTRPEENELLGIERGAGS